MKYSLIVYGKFCFFKIAETLLKSEKLVKLYTSYPKLLTIETPLRPMMVSLGFLHIMTRLGHRIFPKGGPNDQILKMIFSIFMYWKLKFYDDGADVYMFLGQNGFYKKLIKLLKKRDRKIIIINGSAHPRTRNELMQKLIEQVSWETKTRIIPDYILSNYDHELKLADLIIAPSDFVAKSLIKEMSVIKDKVRTIPFGLDLSSNPIVGDNTHKNKIIILGNVSGQKGYDYINSAAKNFPDLIFEFVGEVERNIPKDKAHKNIKFLGKIKYKNVQKILPQYDALLIASIQDGFGAVVPQAIAAGLNVLASKNVGAIDICSDEIDLFFNPFDASAIRDAISQFYENHHLLRNRAIKRALSPLEFSWMKFMKETENNLIQDVFK